MGDGETLGQEQHLERPSPLRTHVLNELPKEVIESQTTYGHGGKGPWASCCCKQGRGDELQHSPLMQQCHFQFTVPETQAEQLSPVRPEQWEI